MLILQDYWQCIQYSNRNKWKRASHLIISFIHIGNFWYKCAKLDPRHRKVKRVRKPLFSETGNKNLVKCLPVWITVGMIASFISAIPFAVCTGIYWTAIGPVPTNCLITSTFNTSTWDYHGQLILQTGFNVYKFIAILVLCRLFSTELLIKFQLWPNVPQQRASTIPIQTTTKQAQHLSATIFPTPKLFIGTQSPLAYYYS